MLANRCVAADTVGKSPTLRRRCGRAIVSAPARSPTEPMPHRLQITAGTPEIEPCSRGVKVAPFTQESGYRWLWSVDSKGVFVSLRTVPPGADFTPYVDALWDELDRVDPMPD